MDENRLRSELEDSFRNRAHLYRILLEELTARDGAAEAEAIMIAVCETRGREVAKEAFGAFCAPDAETDARKIGEAFLAASPAGGELYPVVVERFADGIAFQVTSCPLKNAWKDAGLSDARIATLCRIAGAFDRGLFEATGIHFANRTWTPGAGEGCCHIELRNTKSG
jgi:L-2-amino-thiazoline-4-carboxylic acid hydrolase